ncbi:MAG TPA: phage portal protein [Armatimonadota bacterium]|mgnify:CR=1 FL=1|nr:phage portal protein [Armatimonadota bacterium]
MTEAWYSAEDARRWSDYRRYEQLFEGRHEEAFNLPAASARRLQRYLVCNVAGVVSKTCADILFGESPRFVTCEAAAGEAVARLARGTDLRVVGYEAALAASFRGDAVLKVRWTEAGARIEEVPAGLYLPELDPDDVRGVRRVTLAWLRQAEGKTYLRREVHEPGLVRNLLHEVESNGYALKEPVALARLYGADAPPEEAETGLPAIPVIHLPNYRTGSRFWGYSDYLGLESLFAALNERLSQVSEVLRKHAAPRLAVPQDYIRPDGTVALEDLEVIPFDPQFRPRPEYLTWDAHLSAAFTEIDRLLEMILLVSESAPAMFGLEKYGIAESGRALKYRLLRTLAKIARKRAYFAAGLRQALYLAQCCEVLHGARYTPEYPEVEWNDGLPNDPQESASIEQTLLAAGATSLRGSLERLHPEWTPEQVAREEGLIREGVTG